MEKKKNPPPHPSALSFHYHIIIFHMLHTLNDLYMDTLLFFPFNSLSPLFFAHSACVTLRQLRLSLHFDTMFFLNPLTCTPSCLLSSRLVDVLFMFISVCLLLNKGLYSNGLLQEMWQNSSIQFPASALYDCTFFQLTVHSRAALEVA